jgi:hypothetical protein
MGEQGRGELAVFSGQLAGWEGEVYRELREIRGCLILCRAGISNNLDLEFQDFGKCSGQDCS